MTDDRSERLRQRRKQSSNRRSLRHETADEGDERDERDERSEAASDPAQHRDDEPESSRRTSDSSSTAGESIKDKQTGTYMYLPESQAKELRRTYNVLKAEYEYRYDEEFEKNRHFYPLVIQFGLERLDGMEAGDIRSHLDDIR